MSDRISASRTLLASDLIVSVEVTNTSLPPSEGSGNSRTRSTVQPAASSAAVWMRSPRGVSVHHSPVAADVWNR